MLKTNAEKLIKIAVMGEIAALLFAMSTTFQQQANPALPGVGGITYNLRVGDPAVGWEADHVEPGVSVENKKTTPRSSRQQCLQRASHVGNQATIVTEMQKVTRAS